MSPIFIIAITVLLLIGFVLLKPLVKRKQREKIKSQVFPKPWRQILKKNIPYFYTMPVDIQLQIKQHIMVFLAEKEFYGFEGVEINDEIRITIAAQACLLILNRKTNYYPKLKSIYVYPAGFITQHSAVDGAGVLQNQKRVLSGESWELGKVILSWKDSHEGGSDFNDGRNVIIHEFAHQLDQETGVANGAPFLKKKANSHWSSVLSKEFENLQRKAKSGQQSIFDYYGATNPAEFFAVASEVFFEQPKDLEETHPNLYQQLSAFYHVSPALW